MKKNKMYFDKEKKLKITVALLIALSGILAGIVELFSNCGCCCVNAVKCDLCPVKIILLVVNVVAVLTALIADIIGICEYGKTSFNGGKTKKKCKKKKDDFETAEFPEDEKELPNIEDTYYRDDDSDTKQTLEYVTEAPAEKDTDAPDERTNENNKIFLCSLITTAISFVMLCVSVVVITIINMI